MQADLIARDKAGHIFLIVEVENRKDMPASWAKHYFRNLRAHGVLPDSPFFMLLGPTRLFLWKNHGIDVDPDQDLVAEINVEEVFQIYLRRANIQDRIIGPSTFDLIADNWLGDLTLPFSKIHDEMPESVKEALQSTGLLERLSGGVVESEVLV